MIGLELKKVNLTYPILGSSSKSLRSRIVKNLTGGIISAKNNNDIIHVNALQNINFKIN